MANNFYEEEALFSKPPQFSSTQTRQNCKFPMLKNKNQLFLGKPNELHIFNLQSDSIVEIYTIN